jgi:hypothetical protein
MLVSVSVVLAAWWDQIVGEVVWDVPDDADI